MQSASTNRSYGDGKMSILKDLLKADNGAESHRESEQKFLLISDVAEIVDLEPKTIRFYEKAGLLMPQRIGQLRVFSKAEVEILLLIKKFRQYDMPIYQIREALSLHHQQCEDGDFRLKEILQVQRDCLLDKHQKLTKQIEVLESALSGGLDKIAA
jgi:DNA-binding transcriptional MerR regulator